MGLPHDTDIEIPDSFFRPNILQIEEAMETNNQAELATTTHECQCILPRTRQILILPFMVSMFQLPV